MLESMTTSRLRSLPSLYPASKVMKRSRLRATPVSCFGLACPKSPKTLLATLRKKASCSSYVTSMVHGSSEPHTSSFPTRRTPETIRGLDGSPLSSPIKTLNCRINESKLMNFSNLAGRSVLTKRCKGRHTQLLILINILFVIASSPCSSDSSRR